MNRSRSGGLRSHIPELAILATLIAAPVVLPHLGFSIDLLTRVLNWGLIGLGFDILFGLAGLLSSARPRSTASAASSRRICWFPAR